MTDDKEKSTALRRIERTDLERAGDLNLGLSQTTTWRERARLWGHEQISKAQAQALEAKQRLHTAAASFLRSQEHLQQEIERNQHWKENPEVIRKRVREEFAAEEEERQISRNERHERLAEQERKAREAQDKLAATKAQIAAARQRREGLPAGETSKPTHDSAEDIFRKQAEQILNHGSTGRYMPIAEQCRAELVAKRGGEEHLTDDDRERIELMFQLARQKQESRS